jgi:hypothetical protein
MPLTATISFPKIAGYWVIARDPLKTQFPVGQRPAWLHRTMTRLLLGWEWKDNTTSEND